MKRQKIKLEKGITLIALVITIIVFLILAGVTIAMLTGDNGIISRAQESVNQTNEATENEKKGLSNIEEKMEEILGTIPIVKDGLVLYYDGINNTDNGHSDTTSIWKDLSGNNRDGTLSGTFESNWNNDSIQMNGTNNDISSPSFTDIPLVTVQIVIDIPIGITDAKTTVSFNGYTQGTWMGNPNYSWWRGSADYYFTPPLARQNKKQMQTLIIDSVNKKIKMKVDDGDWYEMTVPNEKVVAINKLHLGNLNYRYNNFIYYSARLYDRELTDEEIRKNYEVDKVRFGI